MDLPLWLQITLLFLGFVTCITLILFVVQRMCWGMIPIVKNYVTCNNLLLGTFRSADDGEIELTQDETGVFTTPQGIRKPFHFSMKTKLLQIDNVSPPEVYKIWTQDDGNTLKLKSSDQNQDSIKLTFSRLVE